MQEYNIVLAIEKIVEKLEILVAKLQQQSSCAPPKKRLISSAEVLLMLRISDSTLKRMRKNKEIPCEKIGKSYYYPSSFFEKMFRDANQLEK